MKRNHQRQGKVVLTWFLKVKIVAPVGWIIDPQWKPRLSVWKEWGIAGSWVTSQHTLRRSLEERLPASSVEKREKLLFLAGPQHFHYLSFRDFGCQTEPSSFSLKNRHQSYCSCLLVAFKFVHWSREWDTHVQPVKREANLWLWWSVRKELYLCHRIIQPVSHCVTRTMRSCACWKLDMYILRWIRSDKLCSYWSVVSLNYFLGFEYFLSVILHDKLTLLLLAIIPSSYMCTVSWRSDKATTENPMCLLTQVLHPYHHQQRQAFSLLLTLQYLYIWMTLLYSGFPAKMRSLVCFPRKLRCEEEALPHLLRDDNDILIPHAKTWCRLQ